MKSVNPFPIIVSVLVIFLVAFVLRYAAEQQRGQNARERVIDVKETCEQLHAFVHNGRKYYCAPWIEADTNESAPAAQETTHA